MAKYKKGTQKKIKCMNHDLKNSKWRAWAPEGGCDEEGMVDEGVTKWLCWRCTGRTTGNPTNKKYMDEV
jgi:hypothetical protein